MIIVVADTAGLLAALDSARPEHHGSNAALLAAPGIATSTSTSNPASPMQ